MRKVCYSLLVLMVLTLKAYSQLGPEWINFSQPYFKIPVAKDGIYRLTTANLAAAGFPTATVNPTRIQLFHRGVEQAIYVEGEGDLAFNDSDFIEFYGRKMMAPWMPSSIRRPHYSLTAITTYTATLQAIF